MKKTILILYFWALACGALGTTKTIVVANYSFTPSSLSIHIGDTVKFIWSNGTHTIKSIVKNYPPKAAPINVTLSASNAQFTYIPTSTGNYQFECSNHKDIIMNGNIQVNPPAGAIGPWPLWWIAGPIVNNVSIHMQAPILPKMMVYITDGSGKKTYSTTTITDTLTNIDVSSIPRGSYDFIISSPKEVFRISSWIKQ